VSHFEVISHKLPSGPGERHEKSSLKIGGKEKHLVLTNMKWERKIFGLNKYEVGRRNISS
jgi:hypothetical protein